MTIRGGAYLGRYLPTQASCDSCLAMETVVLVALCWTNEKEFECRICEGTKGAAAHTYTRTRTWWNGAPIAVK